MPNTLARPDTPSPLSIEPTVQRPRISVLPKTAPAISIASPAETSLPPLKPYSKEWWDREESTEKAEDARMAKVLIICRSCLEAAPATTQNARADDPKLNRKSDRQAFSTSQRNAADER